MSNKISENTELTLDLKTLVIIVTFVVTVVGAFSEFGRVLIKKFGRVFGKCFCRLCSRAACVAETHSGQDTDGG